MSIILDFLKNKELNENTLVSLFLRIEKINFDSVINQIKGYNNFFTFFNSKNQFNFIAIDGIKNEINFDLPFKRISNVDVKILEEFPLFVGYKKFNERNETNLWNDFDENKWFIPKFIIVQNKNENFLIHNFWGNEFDETELNLLLSIIKNNTENKTTELKALLKKDENYKSLWKEKVELALKKINENNFEKVVLARKTELDLTSKFSLSFVINSLLNNCNDCLVFSIKEANSIFFGATPEKLFSINKNILQTEALAGSIERSSNETEDAFLGNQLLRDPKELSEQKKVLDYILSILSNFSSDIKYNEIPFIKKLNSVQHLQTKINATINDDFDILKFLENIHPTPAVCGYPKNEAMNFILATENFDRGLYAGVVGWFNNYNVGEFYVGIRSALLKENKLFLFAGCGIVDGSIPEKEYQETQIKLKPILSLFSL